MEENELPAGFRFAGKHCGIKTDAAKKDITVIACEQPTVAAGVYTTNQVVAASVEWNRKITPADHVWGVVVNSGNANACTGDQGRRDCERMAKLTAEQLKSVAELPAEKAQDVLVMSTGIIGQTLPMANVESGIERAVADLAGSAAGFRDAAHGILTTDQAEKVATKTVQIAEEEYRVAGMAKGAGMIGPNMATMLAVITTDASLLPKDAAAVLRYAVDLSFNRISVDGHASTNDTVLLLASGRAADRPLTSEQATEFADALADVCRTLAKQIPADGEGATHLIEMEVTGAASEEDALQIARTVCASPLVKTAVAGGDPNWGRIISAAGNAGIELEPEKLTLTVQGVPLYVAGEPVEFDEAAVSVKMKGEFTTQLRLDLGMGTESADFFASDLNVEYVKFNAEYHT